MYSRGKSEGWRLAMTRQTKTELSAATVLQHWVPFPSVSLPQGPPMGHHILAFEKKTKKKTQKICIWKPGY